VNPRIRIVAFVLSFAVLAAFPSGAAAASACPGTTDLPPFALATVDATAPSGAWQQGSPAGTVDVPLIGAGATQWEYKIDCGGTVNVIGAGGTVPVTGNGTHRLSHRAHDGVSWTEWTDHFVRIDATVPANTTVPPTTNWQKGPVNVALTGTDATSLVHMEWRVGGGAWTPGNSASVTGTGTHQLESAAVDEAGNRTERNDTVKVDDTLPVDTTMTPVGWQNGPVNVTVNGTDADSGVDRVEWQLNAQPIGAGPAGTVVNIGIHGQHNFRTRVIDEVGNASAWTDRPVWVDIQGPADTTVIPNGWITTPSTVIDITADDNGASGIKRIQWELDGTTTGDVANTDTTPVTVTGDGVHELEVRITDNQDRVLEWHTHQVKIDTVNPVDNTTVAAGWLPLEYYDVLVRGTDAHSQVQGVEWRLDGGDIMSASSNNYEVRVSGNGVHFLETRIVDNAGRRSGWASHTVKLDAGLPTNTTPTVPAGWRNTPYTVTLNGTDGGSDVASVNSRVQLEGQPAGAEVEGTRNVTQVTINQDGTHTLSTRVRDNAGNYSAWRDETVRIDRVLPTDGTTYPAAPVGNRHVVTFSPQDDRSGVAGVEWKLDGGSVQTTPTAQITGAGAHTLSVRVQDNAGNWSAWADHAITVQLGLDTTAPTDTTVVPATWRLGATTISVTAEDDIDGTGVDYVQWRYGDVTDEGPSGTQITIPDDGEHEIETRAFDHAGNATSWRGQTLRVDSTPPTDTSTVATGWTNSRQFTVSATDATSGIAGIEYKIDNAAPVQVAGTTTVTLPADGNYRVRHRAIDNAGRISAWTTHEFSVDTVAPANTSAVAPNTWQTSALSLALTGTDADSGVDHAEWRVDGGDIQTGSPALVETQGTQALETRIVDKAGNVSGWRSDPIRIDTTKPVNTTAAVTAPWRKTNFTTTVTGTDATPGSGVARIEYKLDNGAITTTPAVSITAAGTHKLETRVVDVAGNESDWRVDTIGIDKTNPTLSVDCGGDAWRAAPAVCSITAAGGDSGLPTLTASRGGASDTVSGNSYTVDADGSSTVLVRAVDGAGNETLASAAVKIDRTAPTAAVTCTAGAGTTYVCKGGGADDLSGVTSMSWSVDGSAATPMSSGGNFVVTKGKVVVTAVDAAGNVGVSAPVALADRTPPVKAPTHDETDTVTPRTTSEAVLLKRGGKASARLIGQLAISATPTRTTVDLRPLALGAGRFKIALKVTTDKKSKTYTKTVKTRKGYTSRIQVKAAAAAHATVKLTIKRKSGKRWVTYASGGAELE
jgi:hypothetical protein